MLISIHHMKKKSYKIWFLTGINKILNVLL